jgi:hypothetical protein
MNTLALPDQLELELTEATTFDEWTKYGRAIFRAGDALRWRLADWAHFGIENFERFANFATPMGFRIPC